MTTETVPVGAIEIRQETHTLAERCRAILVVDDVTYEQGGALLIGLRSMNKRIDAVFDGLIAQAHAHHRAIIAQKKEHSDPLTELERSLKAKMRDYSVRRQREQEAEAARIREEQRKAEEDRRLAQAQELEREGKAEQAEALLERPIETMPVVLPPPVPKTAGVTVREKWCARVVDVNLVPREYLVPNMVALGALARTLKSRASVPGVEFYDEGTVSVSAR